jgi:hypothetical protein
MVSRIHEQWIRSNIAAAGCRAVITKCSGAKIVVEPEAISSAASGPAIGDSRCRAAVTIEIASQASNNIVVDIVVSVG